jgi:hypothetical protein
VDVKQQAGRLQYGFDDLRGTQEITPTLRFRLKQFPEMIKLSLRQRPAASCFGPGRGYL